MVRLMTVTALGRRLKGVALWLVDHAGPAGGRQGRRESAVALRVKAVRLMKRWAPADRRRRAVRLKTIANLSAAETQPGSPATSERIGAPKPVHLGGRRIAIFIPGFLGGFGGAEKVAGQVAGLLARSGAMVDLVCIRPSDAVRPYQLESGVELQILERYGEEIRLKPRDYELMIGFGMPGFYRRIPAIADVLGVPFVIQECTNPEAMRAALANSLALEGELESHWLRQAVLAHAAAARFTTPLYATTVHPAIAPFTYGFYNAFARPPGGAPSVPRKKIVCVGALKNRNKNGLAAAEAFAAFAKRHPGWSLHFYGENNFSAALERIRAASPNIEIVDEGRVKNIDDIYADASVLVIPSYEEGLPNVVVEAFTYGIPCIGFEDCPGVNSLIKHEKTGLLASRSEPLGLAAAMSRLADPQFRRELSVHALAFAAAELGIEAWEASWLRLVANALDGVDRDGRPALPAAGPSDTMSAWRSLLATYPLRG